MLKVRGLLLLLSNNAITFYLSIFTGIVPPAAYKKNGNQHN